jgi:hypothetical protein
VQVACCPVINEKQESPSAQRPFVEQASWSHAAPFWSTGMQIPAQPTVPVGQAVHVAGCGTGGQSMPSDV